MIICDWSDNDVAFFLCYANLTCLHSKTGVDFTRQNKTWIGGVAQQLHRKETEWDEGNGEWTRSTACALKNKSPFFLNKLFCLCINSSVIFCNTIFLNYNMVFYCQKKLNKTKK